jgi:poly(3-hydroxybutyrate) depolymerase
MKMVALVAGGAPEFHDGDQKRTDECVICPAGPIPIFIAHGMNDQSDAPFEGGDFARICWAEQNGCTNSSLHQIGGPCSTYNGCKDGNAVEWCPVPDWDHAPWTGSIQAAWTMFSGL